MKDLIGKRITAISEFTPAEMVEMGWEDEPYPAIMIHLDGDYALIAARDEELNGPGHMLLIDNLGDAYDVKVGA